MTSDGIDDGWEVDAGAVVTGSKDGTLDDVEEDLIVDAGVILTGGVDLLGPGARLAMTRWRRSAIRSETDALLAKGAILARDLCWC